MNNIFISYFNSLWGISVNIMIVIVFGLMAYNKYAKRWSAMTGKHSTLGRITWSQYVEENKRVLISYAYSVDGVPYNGEIPAISFNTKKVLARYPKGKEITVYYAAKDPAFSKTGKPPSHAELISSILWYLTLPLSLINIPSIFLYWLVSINQ